jgi:hypothetical protein
MDWTRKVNPITLGNPRANGIKFFATGELLELAKDKAWLVKVTNAVNQHWQKNNASKKNGEAGVVMHQVPVAIS